jgi:ketosteroid isomerase-like protein
VGEVEMSVVRRANERFLAGDLDGAFELWSEDGIGIPPSNWPEPGPWRGTEDMQHAFEGWSAAFGADWTEHLSVRRETDLGGGRVLSEYEFNASGTESGIPVDEQLAAIYTVRDGKMVRGDFFMSHAEARRAAELE